MATRLGERRVKPSRQVSEAAREDEMFRYTSVLSSTVLFNESKEPVPSSELSTCSDEVLTGLCQLGPYQTGTGRALLSLFDAQYQYIVAEAMPSMLVKPSLSSDDCPAPLWLCGTAIPRVFGVCEATVLGEKAVPGQEADVDLPLTLSNDLTTDPRFCGKPYCQRGGQAHFYAAVPLRTRRGINIGVYCVMDERPDRPWTDAYTAHLQSISQTIMSHLETRRLDGLHRRNERMNRGLGSFVEGETTLSGWRFSPNAAAYEDEESTEGALNTRQQSLGLLPNHHTPRTDVSTPMTPNADSTEDSYFTMTAAPTPKQNDKANVFSRAANIIRESIEVEGCVFYRPKLSFHARQDVPRKAEEDAWNYSSSSASGGETNLDTEARGCHVLGFSDSHSSSIDYLLHAMPGVSMTENFLATLLRRYPRGAIFNFDADGELVSSDSSGDEVSQAFTTSDPFSRMTSLENPKGQPTPAEHYSRPRNKRSRQQEGKALREAFPLARSVVFSPVWDSRRDSWYSGVFAYTQLARRSFTAPGELSYLRAFSAVVASKIHELDTVTENQAKADALGALSHELRSPLHGVLLSAELMGDTDLDVHQGNLAHTIETCSRTLLDTIDHLLDYAQINDFSKSDKKVGGSVSTSVSARRSEGQFGKKSLFSHVRLDEVVEEVVDSVFAGFNFQYRSLKQASQAAEASDVAAHQRLDAARALEQTHGLQGAGSKAFGFGQVSVILTIDPGCQWTYHVHVGAIRRIVMNLFGNALKYTSAGTISVRLSQESALIRRRKRHAVRITVQDTGRGMSAGFIETGLFKPFTQEDSISPGTGLGLSLVKKITAHLHGQISIESKVGVGTTASVVLPLERAELPVDPHASHSHDDEEFRSRVRDLKGLRVRIVSADEMGNGILSRTEVSLHEICRDWLHMEIVSADSQASPDVVLWSNGASNKLPDTVDELAKYPNVVICPDVMTAYRRNSESSPSGGRLLEFISQPIGPRKLAKVLSTAYRRWVEPSYSFSLENIAKFHDMPRPRITRNSLSLSAISESHVSPASETTGYLSMQSLTPDTSASETDQLDEAPPATQCLLVDDNDINIKVLAAIMRKFDIGYQIARNGKEALDAFSQDPQSFKCILMDISMPVMDGFEATRLIRTFEAKEQLTAVSIIALSGLSSDQAHREAFESGMDLFLTKPVKLVALKELLSSRGIL